jgi:hypothetical protein
MATRQPVGLSRTQLEEESAGVETTCDKQLLYIASSLDFLRKVIEIVVNSKFVDVELA